VGELAAWIGTLILCAFTGVWFLLVAPLLYTFYRAFSSKKVCHACGHDSLVPVDSPRGRELVDHYRGSASRQ
jgi:hypothetical protein